MRRSVKEKPAPPEPSRPEPETPLRIVVAPVPASREEYVEQITERIRKEVEEKQIGEKQDEENQETR